MKEVKLLTAVSFNWKLAFFSGLQNLMEYNVVGPYTFGLLQLVETLQLLYFPFIFPQRHEPNYPYIGLSFGVFTYAPLLLDTLGSEGFLWLWAGHYLLLLLIVGMMVALVLSYHKTNERESFLRKLFLQTLSVLLALQRTVFTIPAVFTFAVPVLCSSTHENCWSGVYIAVSLFSVIALVIFCALVYAIDFFRDSYANSTLPWAGPDSRGELMHEVLKIAFALYTAGDSSHDATLYVYGLVLVYMGYLMYHRYYDVCWYNLLNNTLRSAQLCLVFWCLLLTYFFSVIKATMQVDLSLWAMSTGLVVALTFYLKQRQRVLLAIEQDLTTLNEENLAVNCCRVVSLLPEQANVNAETQWILSGILNVHREHCTNVNCVCSGLSDGSRSSSEKDRIEGNERLDPGYALSGNRSPVASSSPSPSPLPSPLPPSLISPMPTIQGSGGISPLKSLQTVGKEELLPQGSKELKQEVHKKPDKKPQSPSSYQTQRRTANIQVPWPKLIGVVLDEVVAKFPKSVNLRLMVSNYQDTVEKNYYKAYLQLVKAGEKDCSYGQQLAIHRMKMILDKAIYALESTTTAEDSEKAMKVIEIDLAMFRHFEDKRRQFDLLKQTCTEKIRQFWTLLLSVSVKIDAIYSLGGHISTALKEVHYTFSEIIRIFPEHVQTYKSYADFLRSVANNEIEAREYYEKAAQIRRNIRNSKRQACTDDSSFSINRETAIIVISGNLDSLGQIQNYNEHAQTMFGYSYNELVGLSISRLMPKLLAVAHNKFMLRFAETGKPISLNRQVLRFAESNSGLLVPIAILVKTMPGLDEGLKYISFIKRDLDHIKKNVIKLPYQYQKHRDVNFILTDMKGSIVGISETTARTLGIPQEYFEMKKALFNTSLNIKKLNKKLVRNENEEELKKGVLLDINLKQFYEMIDKDFLSVEEAETLMRQPTMLDIYIQLTTYEHCYDVKYKVFTFVLAGRTEQDRREEHKAEDLRSNEEENDNDGNLSKAGGSVTSGATHADRIKNLVKELKKNIFEHKESRQIVFLKRLLYVSFPLLLTLAALNLGYTMYYFNTVLETLQMSETSHLRRSLVVALMEQLQAYREIGVGLETPTPPFDRRRVQSLQEDMSIVLERTKNNEYNFQDCARKLILPDIETLTVYPGSPYNDVFRDATISLSREALPLLVLQIVTKVNRLIKEVALAEWNTPIIKGIFNKTLNASRLNQVEKDILFSLRNGLYHVVNASTNIIDALTPTHNNALSEISRYSLLFFGIYWGVIITTIVIAIPIMKKVQAGKRAILRFFAEVPKKTIETILRQCEDYDKAELSLRKRKRRREVTATPNNATLLVANVFLRLAGIGGKPPPGRGAPQQARLLAAKNRKSDDPEDRLEDEDEIHEADKFQEERKKKLLTYNTGLGMIFWLLLVSMLIIGGYGVLIYMTQLSQNDLLLENYVFVRDLQSRWFYPTALMVYVLSSIPSYQILDFPFNVSCADRYMIRTLDSEDAFRLYNTRYPRNQANIITTLQKCQGPELCTILEDLSILNKTRCNVTCCLYIQNRVMLAGLSPGIFYVITETRNRYMEILKGLKLVYIDYYVNMKIIFEYLLRPTFEYFAELGKKQHYDLLRGDKLAVIGHSVGIMGLIIIVLFLLIKFFAGTLNNELWNAKGIVSLLPLEIIEKNPEMKEEFSKQMNIII